VSGLCNQQSCPLGNSRYATIREHEGKAYLYMKTIERAHTPATMWERVLLPRNYAAAIKLIDEHLMYWPSFLKFKCKQRLTRIHQYLIRMRKLKLKSTTKLVRIHKKSERRDLVREKKAEKAAKISGAIQKELLARLNDPDTDMYDGIYNFPRKEFKKVVSKNAEGQEEEEDEEDMESEEMQREEEDEMVGVREELFDEFVEDESDGDDIEDGVMYGRFAADDDDLDDEDGRDDELDEMLRQIRKRKSSLGGADAGAKKPRRPRVEVEEEGEMVSGMNNNNA
jgi:protein MAK16